MNRYHERKDEISICVGRFTVGIGETNLQSNLADSSKTFRYILSMISESVELPASPQFSHQVLVEAPFHLRLRHIASS